MRWPLQPLRPFQKTQLQTPFGPSVDSLCRPRIATIELSYSVLSLKLPPPPCAVLLVFMLTIPAYGGITLNDLGTVQWSARFCYRFPYFGWYIILYSENTAKYSVKHSNKNIGQQCKEYQTNMENIAIICNCHFWTFMENRFLGHIIYGKPWSAPAWSSHPTSQWHRLEAVEPHLTRVKSW